MEPRTLLVLAVLVLVAAAGEALFTPRCLWGGLLGDLGDLAGDETRSDRWLRDTRVRRFLWTDSDVCDWMCKEDYGLEVRDICRRCCPTTAATAATTGNTGAAATTGNTGAAAATGNAGTTASSRPAETSQAAGSSTTATAVSSTTTQPPSSTARK